MTSSASDQHQWAGPTSPTSPHGAHGPKGGPLEEQSLGNGILKEISKGPAQGLWQLYQSSIQAPCSAPPSPALPGHNVASSRPHPKQEVGQADRQRNREGAEKARGQMEYGEAV